MDCNFKKHGGKRYKKYQRFLRTLYTFDVLCCREIVFNTYTQKMLPPKEDLQASKAHLQKNNKLFLEATSEEDRFKYALRAYEAYWCIHLDSLKLNIEMPIKMEDFEAVQYCYAIGKPERSNRYEKRKNH